MSFASERGASVGEARASEGGAHGDVPMSTAAPPTHSLLPLGHELFQRAVPWLAPLVRATVDEARGSPLVEETGTIPGLSLSKVPAFNAWMKSVFEVSVRETGDREQGKHFLKAVMPHL